VLPRWNVSSLIILSPNKPIASILQLTKSFSDLVQDTANKQAV